MEKIKKATELKKTPLVKKEVKVQNNEPCPCRSGKKYKHCCGKQFRYKMQAYVIETRKKRREAEKQDSKQGRE